MPLPRDESELPPQKPLTPCVVCGTPSDIHPICERWQLCLPCLADFFEDTRFGADLEKNIAVMPAWIADMKQKLREGAA